MGLQQIATTPWLLVLDKTNTYTIGKRKVSRTYYDFNLSLAKKQNFNLVVDSQQHIISRLSTGPPMMQDIGRRDLRIAFVY